MPTAANDPIDVMAQRSDNAVYWIALGFAIAGGCLDNVMILIRALFVSNGDGISLFWGIWIPFCLLTIPAIYYLCRRVQALETRLDELTQERVAN